MELLWVISWLAKLKRKSEVDVFTDSKYTINWIEKWWAKKWRENNWYRTKTEKAMNYDLWEQLLDLVDKHNVKFHWIKWHNWHKENERCDELATKAMNMTNLLEDKFFIKHYDDWKIAVKINNPSKKIKILEEWDICWKCNTPVVKRTPKKKKLKPNQRYYFEYYLYCPWCKTMYMVDKAKVFV
jgi:ribonuclease HI